MWRFADACREKESRSRSEKHIKLVHSFHKLIERDLKMAERAERAEIAFLKISVLGCRERPFFIIK